MAIVATEYEREAFLDEYSPLCHAKVTPRRSKIEQFRRRCFSEVPLTNNPLSKFRPRAFSKKEKKKSTSTDEYPSGRTFERSISDSKVDMHVRHKRASADSGYFDIDRDEQIYFLSPDGETKWDDMEPFFEEKTEEDLTKIEKASTFMKKQRKFLQYRYNLKLRKNKEKLPKTPTSPKFNEKNSENNNNGDSPSKQIEKSRKLSWRKAKKQASLVVRYIKREAKEEDQIALVRAASIRMSRRSFGEHYRERDESIAAGSKNENQISVNEKESFEDSFVNITLSSTTPRSPLTDASPLSSKYLSAHNIARSRPRSHSVYLFSETFRTEHTDEDNNSCDFIEKYLNRSKSLEEILHENKSIEHSTHNHEATIFSKLNDDPFDDFEPECTILCTPNNSFVLPTVEEKDEEKDDLSLTEYENIVEAEVDKYLLNSLKYNGDNIIDDYLEHDEDFELEDDGDEVDNYLEHCGDTLKASHSFSYSVNDLYELFNRDTLLTLEYGNDELLV